MPIRKSGNNSGADGSNNVQPADEIPKAAMSINEFCQRYDVCRTSAYKEMNENRLRAKKCGRRTLVPTSEANRWLESLEAFDEKVD